jgi:hypothetical protein
MMMKTLACGLLFATVWLGAQNAPAPEIMVDVNGQSEAAVANGWPLLIRAMVISTDGQPLTVGLSSGGAWTQALQVTITGPDGTAQTWSLQAVAPASNALSLAGTVTGEAVWLVSADDSANLMAGQYSLTVTLDTTTNAADGAWSGSIQSGAATLQLDVEPATLSPEDEASKFLAIAAYSRLQGDFGSAKAALDTLMTRQPDMLEAYVEKADLLAADGDYAGALALDQTALDKFNARIPAPVEAPTVLRLKVMTMADRLAAQQQQSQNQSAPKPAAAAPKLRFD